MKKKIFILLICIIVMVAIILIAVKSKEDTSKIIETNEKTAEVSTQSIITTLTAPGEVQSANVEKLTLNTSYYYLTMCAEQDELVKEGENLLKYTNGTYVTAPYDCVITGYSVPEVKDICTSSNYIQISSVEDLYMDINIGEDKIDKVTSGQEVDIVVSYDETKEYKGTISKINAIGTRGNGATNFAAIASMKNDGNLKLGMSATCTITLDKHDELTCLPIESIIIEDEKKYVNLLNGDGTTTKTEVETGVADANYVQILSGLELGDEVKYETTTVTVLESEEEEDTENPLSSMFNMGGGKENRGTRSNRGGF
ncbi:MAG: HlyD family efflux transporter periplasmic adaptor subunit [Clostridia bacterium]|nr:HlyD family efflux transporter periplasmic adaptor subunit [Clostridia bacterium]